MAVCLRCKTQQTERTLESDLLDWMSYLTGVLVDVIHNLGKYVTGYVLEGDQGEVTLRQPALSKVVYQKGLKIVTSATEEHLQKDSTCK